VALTTVTHLAPVRGAEVDRHVHRAEPAEEVLVAHVRVQAHPAAEPALPHDRLDVVALDPPTDQRDVHVRGQARDRREHLVDQLGRVQVAEHPDQPPHPHRLERTAEHRPPPLGLPEIPLGLDHGMRGHEHRRAAAERPQVALDERRVRHDPSGAPRHVRNVRHAQRLVHQGLLEGGELRRVRHALTHRLVAQRVAGRDHAPHEVVERQVVDHDEPRGLDRVAVDVPVELDVVPKVVHAHRVPGDLALVPRLQRPDRLDLAPEADASQAVQHRPRVRRDAAAGRGHRREPRDPGVHPVVPAEQASRRADHGVPHHYSVSRATTSGQPGTRSRISAFPASPIAWAIGRFENRTSNA
jgi:hypothetical protein